jgi:hypothetical protein
MTKRPKTGNPAKSSRVSPRTETRQEKTMAESKNNQGGKGNEDGPQHHWLAAIINKINPASHHPKGRTDQQRTKDANAYETARATTWIAIFAFVTAILAGLQWCAVVGANRDSTAVQRAFVFSPDTNKNCIDAGCLITPIWQNTGNTPTAELRVADGGELVPMDQKPETFTFPLPAKTPLGGMIGPHAAILSRSILMTTDDMQKVVEAKGRFWIWGRAVYRDVFDKTKDHITCFAVEATPIPEDSTTLGNVTTVKVTTAQTSILAVHNCADDSCKNDPCSSGM